MRTSLWILTAAVALVATAHGNIISVTAEDNGDGAVNCTPSWDGSTGTLTVTCVQNWAPGYMTGTVTTDTELDPTMWVINMVQNNTGSAWDGYLLNISMDKAFSIVGIVSPPDWTWAITPPTGSGPQWTGTLEYFGGTPVGTNATASIGYVVTFAGSVNFLQEMIPQQIPEPASMAVLSLAGVALLGWRSRRRA